MASGTSEKKVLVQCSGQKNITNTNSMRQSFGRSLGIVKACTAGLSNQLSAKTAHQSDLERVHRGTRNTSIISEKKTHTIQALNCTEGYCFFTLVVTSFKGLPTLKDGISMDQLEKYGITKIHGIHIDAMF
jgi:hypothetical protein